MMFLCGNAKYQIIFRIYVAKRNYSANAIV